MNLVENFEFFELKRKIRTLCRDVGICFVFESFETIVTS